MCITMKSCTYTPSERGFGTIFKDVRISWGYIQLPAGCLARGTLHTFVERVSGLESRCLETESWVSPFARAGL